MKYTGMPLSTTFRIARLIVNVVRVGIVVTDPGFEQVAKDVQGRRLPSRLLQKFQKLFADVRAVGLEMQVGNKESRHCAYSNVYRDIF